MKKILYTFLGIGIALAGTVYATTVFNSNQVGTNPSNGYYLQTNGSTSSWQPVTGGGGSGGGTWSTTTSQTAGNLINHPNNNTDIVTIGSNSTTTAPFYYDPNIKNFFVNSASTTFEGSIYSFPSFSQGLSYFGTLGYLNSVSTSTLSASSPLTGSFVQIGSGGSLGIQQASISQNGYESAGDYGLIHTATTTFSAPFVYTLSTNAVTCTNASSGVTGCLTGTDWNTFNGKLGSYDPFTHPIQGQSATTSLLLFNGQASSTLFSATTGFFNNILATSTTQFSGFGGTSTPAYLFSVGNGAGTNTGNGYFTGNLIANNFYDTSVSGSTCIGETNGLIGTSNCVSSLASSGSTITVSSPTGAVNIDLNLGHTNTWTVLQNFNYSSSTIYSSFATASTTNLILNGSSFNNLLGAGLSNSSGALTIANGAITNAMLANSTISGVSLGNTLAALTHDTSLTGTSYTGTAAVSDWGLALNHTNSWSVLQNFNGNASSTDFSSNVAQFGSTGTTTIDTVGRLTTPYASSTIYASFIIASTTNSQIGFASTTKLSIGNIGQYAYKTPGFTIATTTAWTASTTVMQLPSPFTTQTINSVQCYTDAGTLNVDIYHTSTHLTLFNASTTQGIENFASNNTMTAGEKFYFVAGTPASSPTTLTCTFNISQTI